MAILKLEGFDDGLCAGRWATANGTVSSTYGRHGDGMLVGDNTATGIVSGSLSSNTTQTIGIAIYITDGGVAGGGNHLFGFYASSTLPTSNYCVAVRYDYASETINVLDRTGTTTATAGTTQMNTWYYLELKATFGDGTAGSWELRQDGATLISATSRDTQYMAGTIPAFIRLGGTGDSNDVDAMYIDDIYCSDASGTANTGFLGVIEIVDLYPSGNGATSGLTGSDGNSTDNYLLVDENPPDTTDYVESATEGDKDTYAMGDLTGTPTVVGLVAAAYSQKDDAGAKFLRMVCRSGATDYAGSSIALAESTWTAIEHVWDQDPNTSATWTYTNVNAMEVGQEVRDS